ncbi:DUF4148 domain-containing protein [Massilia sp. METH4]|uniref:DUF4148 domain-containing protein n=1 Tax=Massilia sp. METH4 TaxID=3123041 RepID=UPI0030D44A39
MNTTNTIAALLLAVSAIASGGAAAEGLTREQVRAEVLAARAAGTLTSGGEGYQADIFTPSTRSRADVRAELAAARAAGTQFDGEAYPGPLPQAKPVARTDVQAELAAARAAGTLVAGDHYPASY